MCAHSITRRLLTAISLVLAAAGCSGGSVPQPSEDATSAEPVVAASSDDGRQALDWTSVAADAYDTIAGSGFDETGFTNQWGGFGPEGHHRPELDTLALERIGRPVSDAERADAYALIDSHEPFIRELSLQAHSTLREALDANWQADAFERHWASLQEDTEDRAKESARRRKGGGYIYADTFTTGGWEVEMVVQSSNHPRFHAAFSELRRAVRARDEDVGYYLLSLEAVAAASTGD